MCADKVVKRRIDALNARSAVLSGKAEAARRAGRMEIVAHYRDLAIQTAEEAAFYRKLLRPLRRA